MRIVRLVAIVASITMLSSAAFAQLPKDETKRLNESASVVSEIRNSSNGIPDDVWNKADCVMVMPGLKKAGFIIGGEFGSGVMSCKTASGWSAPVFMALTKGSAGFQVGAQSTDLVLLVMNKTGAEKLLGNKVTLGADASVAAGPVGRTGSAATDAQLSAEMLSYSRSKGLFAGIDLSGGSLRPDKSANEKAYGANASAKDIALGAAHVPMAAEARPFIDSLSRGVSATSGVK